MTVRMIVAALTFCLAPIAVRAADNEDFNPYKNTKVGDFATYKLNIKVGPLTIAGTTTQTITAKTDKEATVKVVSTVNGMESPPQTQMIDLTKPYDPTKASGLPQGVEATVEKLKSGNEKIKAVGKEYESTWTTYKIKAKAMGMDVNADCKVWMSKDIALGVAKMEMTATVMNQQMEMTLELTEAGNKKP